LTALKDGALAHAERWAGNLTTIKHRREAGLHGVRTGITVELPDRLDENEIASGPRETRHRAQ
jgi:hypothetical protein